MSDLVSICIPTYNRPALVREAIESCFQQNLRPLEILVGDDSQGFETQRAMESLAVPADVVLRYERNSAIRGQSRNVNNLFRMASGRHLLLLHDDDLLVPNGLDLLYEAFESDPRIVCVYGMQHVVDADGTMLPERTAEWNRRDRRSAEHSGYQANPIRAALWQHIPNNGYLIDADLARRIGYPDEAEVGQAVDARYIIDIAKSLPSGSLYFLPNFVSSYRLTPNSIARSKTINRRQDLFFDSLMGDDELLAEVEARDGLLTRIAEGAALDAAMAGERSKALRILFSKYYDRPFLSRWTAYRLVCTASSSTGVLLKRMISVQ